VVKRITKAVAKYDDERHVIVVLDEKFI